MNEIKLFISQPMSNHTAEEVLSTRMNIVRKFIGTYPDTPFKVLDNYFSVNPEFEKMNVPNLAYFGLSLTVMAQADVVLFSKDFTTSDGCRIEHALAYNNKMKVIYEDQLNNYESATED